MNEDKLDLQSPDLVNENIEKIAALFPNCITEGENGKVVDFDMLKQELNHAVVEGTKERYRLEWPGKKEAIVTANLPTTKTLRPVREDSVDFDNTENIYIEGDNLEVLKLLQESYLAKIKMIYIDPPYNTGKDFVYRDNFAKDSQDELLESGQIDEYNQRLVVNPETAGRYHSDWLSMMYPRLKLARNLLTDDGVIFISIDDNEIDNLKKLCHELFGEGNVEQYVWDVREDGTMPKTAKKTVRKEHEYIIAAFKTLQKKQLTKYTSYKYADNDEWGNPDNDFRGPWMSANISRGSGKGSGGSKSFIITNPKGVQFDRDWAISETEYKWLLEDNRIYFADNGNGVPRKKIFQNEPVESIQSSIFENLRSSQSASKELEYLFGFKGFDYPKPVELLIRLIQIGGEKKDIYLDFFSGSASTAAAILLQNSIDGGKRKYIQIQIPENTMIESGTYKSGYSNICEIGKERIRRAGNKIKEEKLQNAKKDGMFAEFKDSQDYGFRVYRLADSNMQDVYYKPKELQQNNLDLFADNVKPDRTSEDLLAQVMLDWGLPLSLKIEQEKIGNKQVFKVAGNSLFAYFDKEVDEDFAKELAKYSPLRVVFRDNGFKDDTAKTNVKQLLKQLSPNTEMKVI
jgi:adenine-specific DNA-methyltransferase